MTLHKYMIWGTEGWIVKVISRGHFPTSAIVKVIATDRQMEVDINQLRTIK